MTPNGITTTYNGMQLISVDWVIVKTDRQRTSITEESTEEFANKLVTHGLLHAIVLEANERTVVAGERRLRAVQALAKTNTPYLHNGSLIPAGWIPYTKITDLSPAAVYELELEENISRVDLTWQEKARAMDRLYTLKNIQYQEVRSVDNALPVREFAREITGDIKADAFKERAAVALVVAKHLDDEDVAKAKTQKEALSIIKRKNGALLTAALSQKLADSGYAGGVQRGHTLFHGSAFDFVKTIADSSVDIIITDPPYGIDMDKMGTQSGSTSGHTHGYSDDLAYASDCVRLVAKEGFRVTKASAACYMFCDIKHFGLWTDYFRSAGWYVWPNPIIWDKSPTGSLLGAANGPRHVYETILYAIKGGRAVNTIGADVIRIAGPTLDKRHPAEKPVALYSHLLQWCATPGDTILDLFCGCGGIFPAATAYQCIAMGAELDPAHHATASTRLDSYEEVL